MRRNIQTQWVLLFRWEEGFPVYVYEPLRKKQLSGMLKRGWEICS